MQTQLAAFLSGHEGVVTTAEAARLGISSNFLRGMVRSGVLIRIARGAYVGAADHESAGPTKRHRVRTVAILRSQPGALAASHQSAAVLHRLPVLQRDLDLVHVLHRRPSTETRRHDAFTIHSCPGDGAFTQVGGLSVVVPALAVLGTAVSAGASSGIVAADAALRGELTTRAELDTWLERLRRTPGMSVARHVVEQASPSAESAGESLSRLLMHELGYEVVPQFRVLDEHGRVIARVDFFIPALGVVVEFDGAVKYEGRDGRDALVREKRREDQIRALGYGVVRLVWSDLFAPQKVDRAIKAAAATARRAV
ncbi:type IV toxin-antitoxin system AbiEi family antitoxin domain-containing protein [Ornithinimicrobium sp. LYQ121]|uniref:type IV toxin-antitoxin system AbiEi family antitoxin domain-containing protein n=1 Tax=Ornithinimicrobium sp. LYQ121 TaxID=3378801 RepID=UPI0038541302